jgi:DNA repair exonuclease SbcCD ATPase subunit
MITFEKIRWKNFLSTGNQFTEVDLLRHNTTLITGENGAGKTTMLDALTFVLFGKPYRNINIPQLVNSINEKGCLVEIEFSVGGSSYLVRRGVAPKVFEIHKNGTLVDVCANAKDYQKVLEEQILKFNQKSFCQVVILGSTNYIPFMKLTAADRRTIVESLLDISIFSTMNVLLKERSAALKEKIRDIDNGLTIIREKIEMQSKFISTLKIRSESIISEKQSAILTTEGEIQKLSEQIDNLQTEAVILLESVGSEKEKQESIIGKLNTLHTQIKGNVRSLANEISFYEKNDVCPTCRQGICSDHKEREVSSKRARITEMEGGMDEIGGKITEAQDALNKTKTSLELVQQKQARVNTLIASRVASEKHIRQLESEIKRITEDRTDETSEQEKLEKYHTIEVDICKNKTDANETSSVYSAAALLLKDTGIKKKIISHYLPIINKAINTYLTRMNFFVSFELNENFEEKIKSRYRDEFTYESFSEGEKRRIDLALLFAWRAIASQKNSVNCNLLILDEILDGSLDDNATDAFLDILKTLNTNVRVFVISHKNPESLGDKFKNRMVFKKKNNFSMLAEYTN